MTIGAPPISGVTTRVEQFGRYTLFGKIAAGGMAAVYLAREAEGDVDSWFAIKRVHPHLATRKDVLQMFMNEAKILSRLDHHNICGITDYGIHEDTPYLVMRYLHGAPLSGLLRTLLDQKKPIPVDLMAYVVASTCEGLHYAHDAMGENGQPLGLVHRDISPQNIFVTFAGDVKLLDFGVAKAAGFQSFTRTGHIKGKYAYMSPEQVEALPLDRRSDVFSLGIVLWEMLTGRHLFKRKREIDTLRAITRAVVPAASELNAEVGQGLDAIVAKALVGTKAHRYQSAQDMGRALWSYLTAAQRPTGSDEVAEIMLDTFPDKPPPAEIAQVHTQPDALAPVETNEPAYPLSEVSTGEELIDRSDSSTDPPVPWSPDAPRAAEDPTVPLRSTEVLAVAAAMAEGEASSEVDMDATPLVEDPDLFEEDTGDAPAIKTPDDAGAELIPFHPEDALHSPTIADPNLGREVRAAVEELRTIPPDEVEDVDDDDDFGDATVRAEPLLERPAVAPHPLDDKISQLLDIDVRDTVINDAEPDDLDAGQTASAAMVITTIPKDEISERPANTDDVGPAIEPPPLSLINEAVFDEPPKMSWSDSTASAPPKRQSGTWLIVTLLLLVVSAVVAYVVILEADTAERIAPRDDFERPVAEADPVDPAKEIYNQGQRALLRGELDDAMRHLGRCIEITPTFARCHRALGVLYARRGETNRSIEHYERYLELAPNASDAERVQEMIRAARPRP